jgi:hypothetical protein
MALNVANWQDKQLDELSDLLQASDYSAVAAFISGNFLCIGSRIMTDPSQTTFRVTVNGTDAKAVDLSAGIFQLAGKISQLDSAQTINILDTTYGSWGTGKAAHPTLDRWSIICVKNTTKVHTPALRWFVDDSVDPNTYSQQSVNTLIDKAYYDIQVVHGTDGGGIPAATGGYWTIAEIFVPHGTTSIETANIYDTGDPRGSQATPPNWTSTTRVLRLEFWSTLFGVDHDLTTGYHKSGGWHIGSTLITVTGEELNRALAGAGVTVTSANLTTLTNGSVIPSGVLHSHGQQIYVAENEIVVFEMAAFPIVWTVWDISSYIPVGKTYAIICVEMKQGGPDGVVANSQVWFRPFGSVGIGLMACANQSAGGGDRTGSSNQGMYPIGSSRKIEYIFSTPPRVDVDGRVTFRLQGYI